MSHAKAGSPFGTMEKMGNEKAKKKNKGGKKATKKQNQMVEKFMLIFSVPHINDFTLFFGSLSLSLCVHFTLANLYHDTYRFGTISHHLSSSQSKFPMIRFPF